MARSYSHPVSILQEPPFKILRLYIGVGEGSRLARNASSLIRYQFNLAPRNMGAAKKKGGK